MSGDTGTNNDVILVEAAPKVTNGTAGNDNFELRLNNAGTPDNSSDDVLELFDGTTVIDSRLADLVSSWTINGLAGNDTLLVNYGYSGGFFTNPVIFNGNNATSTAAGNDSLLITGGALGGRPVQGNRKLRAGLAAN